MLESQGAFAPSLEIALSFEDYVPPTDDNIIYSRDVDSGFEAEFNQTRPEIDEDFNQACPEPVEGI